MEHLTGETQNPEFDKIATTSNNNLPIEANGREKSTKMREIQDWLVAYLAQELQIEPEKVDITVPWERYGLDSSTAVVLSGDLQDWLGCELDPEILFEYQTIESLVEYLTKEARVTAKSDKTEEIQAWLVAYLAKELQIEPEKVDITVPWERYGLDSSTAVVLSGDLQDWLGCELDPEILFEYQTIQDLVGYLIQTREVSPPATETKSEKIDKAPISESNSYPLSYNQRSLWFLTKLAPESSAYNVAFSARIRSEIDNPALRRACQKLVDRHPLLRTIFTEQNGEPIQHIQSQQAVWFQEFDASSWSEDELKLKVTEANQRPFDLERDSLLRVSLFKCSQRDYVLLLTVHHIACDGWSIWMLIDELRQLYPAEKNGSVSLAPLEFFYHDYVHWQAKKLESSEGEKLWQYWQQQLSGELPILNLPTDRPRPPVQNYRGASHTFKLTKELTGGLKQLAQAEGASLYMTLLAAFQILLHRYTGQEQILVGSPMKCRNKPEFAKIFGYLVNPAVLRADLSNNPTFVDFLHQVRHTVSGAIAHQSYPFPLLVERLHPDRDSSYSPLFQVDFVLQKPQQSEDIVELFALGESEIKVKLGDLELEPFVIPQQEGQFELTLETIEAGESISGVFKYNTDLFDAVTIERLSENFSILLQGIVANPQERVAQLPILTVTESHKLLIEWNDTQLDYPQDCGIDRLFQERAAKTPDAVAVVFEDRQLTYRELNCCANKLARYLQSLGVKEDVLVGICLERSLEMAISVLGVLKAGGAYLPLDPNYPQERLAYMVSDSQVSIVVTHSSLANSPLALNVDRQETKKILLDRDWPDIAGESEENPVGITTAESLAYVIYTSGSTGKPKGVMIPHRGLVNHSSAIAKKYEITTKDRILQFAAFSFDVAGEEIFPCWLNGATLVLFPHYSLTFTDFVEFVEREGITILNLPAAYWHDLVLAISNDEVILPESVRLVVTGSEQVKQDRLASWQKSVGDRVKWYNAYGPTEATITATLYEPSVDSQLAKTNTVPIGRPIANTEIYILDRYLQPVPIGVVGELHIGGVGLARGYLNRPDLTQEKFIPNPLNKGSRGDRLYKTGDLARYLPDGNIEFFGRIDNQVKIRGFRIELGEIEALLVAHSEVREAAVIAREEQSGDRRLVAYIVSKLTPDRIPYQSKCFLEIDGQTLEVSTEDISKHGVGVVGLSSVLQKDKEVSLGLALPGEEKEFCLPGKIAWYKDREAGIKFQLSAQQQQIVDRSINYFLDNKGFWKFWQRTVTQSLRSYLKEKLPDYMVPSAFVLLEKMPLTPNGKVDRRAFPAPDLSSSIAQEHFVPPRNSTEETLANLWSSILNLEKVGVNDNFFELGGHSLLATQLLSRVRDAFSVQIPVYKLFESPTIANLAELILAEQLEGAESDALADILAEVEELSDEEVKQQLLE